MSAIVPISFESPQYVFNQSGVASFNGGWIDCRKMVSLSINVWWTAVALTNGTLSVVGSNNVAPYGQVHAPATGSIVTLTLTTPTSGNTTGYHGNGGSFAVGTSASSVLIILEQMPALVRLAYVASAGGGADQFNASAMGRSV